MKKIAGTLKLDQAQYRELEAFSKFGADLDRSTQLTIDRGRKNQEILKQDQYMPMPVEEQIAIIYVSTKGYLDQCPLNKIKKFENYFLDILRTQHKNILQDLAKGYLNESIIKVLDQEAKNTAKQYSTIL